MPRSHAWIVCESTGRWAAALRVALVRWQEANACRVAAPRILETRSLTDLEAEIKANGDALGFVEVSDQNLGVLLDLFAKNARRNSRFVALLGGELGRQPDAEGLQSKNRQSAADALLEAGALCVVTSPRQIGASIEIATQYCTVRAGDLAASRGSESIADRAWAALPWQDA